MTGYENVHGIEPDKIQSFPYTKENTKWRWLCIEHARKIMICPCWIVEKNECDECKTNTQESQS